MPERLQPKIPHVPTKETEFAPLDAALQVAVAGNRDQAVAEVREYLSTYGAYYVPQDRLVTVPAASALHFDALFPVDTDNMAPIYTQRLLTYLTMPTIITNFSGSNEKKQRDAWEEVFQTRGDMQKTKFIGDFGEEMTLFELAYMRNQLKANLISFVGRTSDKLTKLAVANGHNDLALALESCGTQAIQVLLDGTREEKEKYPNRQAGVSLYHILPIQEKIKKVVDVEDRIVTVLDVLNKIAIQKGEQIPSQELHIT